jgi:polysaccharide deacetylase 2 family uncharacterized protein YibQ
VRAHHIICMSEINTTNYDTGGMTSKEMIYMQHIFIALDRVQAIYLDSSKSPEDGRERFALQVEYIKNVVLDKDRQADIQKRCDKQKVELVKRYGEDSHEIDYAIGFIVINEVMRYLNDIMELEHHDIIGEVGISRELAPKEIIENDKYGDLCE